MMKKLVLDADYLMGDFYEDAILYGISATMQDYRYCWYLNNDFGYHFRCNSDIEMCLSKKGRQYYFSVFEHVEPNSQLRFYLYNNVDQGEYLLPELRMLNYVLLIKGGGAPPLPEQYEQLVKACRSINSVQFVSHIALNQIQSKANLIF